MLPSRVPGPTYDLADIQRLVGTGAFNVTGTAMQDAGELGFDRNDIATCILGLNACDFYKSMPAVRSAGLHQDVYRTTYLERRLYVKLQLDTRAVVISFKEQY